MDQPTDYVRIALEIDRATFAARYPHPFLLAVNEPLEEEAKVSDETTLIYSKAPELPRTRPASGRPFVLAVRKVHSMIPHSILLGRAGTSDIEIADRQVSKTHAIFRGSGPSWDLSDAGSRNGTWVGNLRLKPRGEAMPLESGDILSFGHRVYLFLYAGDCWDRIRSVRW